MSSSINCYFFFAARFTECVTERECSKCPILNQHLARKQGTQHGNNEYAFKQHVVIIMVLTQLQCWPIIYYILYSIQKSQQHSNQSTLSMCICVNCVRRHFGKYRIYGVRMDVKRKYNVDMLQRSDKNVGIPFYLSAQIVWTLEFFFLDGQAILWHQTHLARACFFWYAVAFGIIKIITIIMNERMSDLTYCHLAV